MATRKTIRFLEQARARMSATTLSLLLLVQQILLPDALDRRWR
jgi:hypothetical protein